MDGWGALTMLIKRQNANKYKKAEFRYELQKKKEDFLVFGRGVSGRRCPGWRAPPGAARWTRTCAEHSVTVPSGAKPNKMIAGNLENT